MEEVMYQLTKLIPYFLLFPFVALIVFGILIFLTKKKVNQKNMVLYGLFMNLSGKGEFLISLLITHFIIEMESLFVMEFSLYSLFFLISPILIFDIMTKRFIKIPFDIIEIIFLVLLIFFKNLFYSYMIDVAVLWYVLLLFVVLCVFIVIFSTYTFAGNINYLVKEKEKEIL